MILHEYSTMAKNTRNIMNKRQKYRNPDTWAQGLILLNWEFVIEMWEARIASTQQTPIGIQPIDTHYHLLQKAIHSIQNNNITNPQDRTIVLKSEQELRKFSTNQLKLWLTNFQTK